LIQRGMRQWFNSPFLQNKMQIKTNGLVWMGDESFMRDQIHEKVNLGFDCVKLKIGALDFENELQLVAFLRKLSSKIIIRLDANGAFEPLNALDKLNQLSEFNIHSIEQPIQKGQWEAMNELCQSSKIPIALDEELIGIEGDMEKQAVLDQIKPAYIILKPSLLGGFMESNQWINWAEERNIGWWVTSALESNIGLNAISQFVAQYPNLSHQGLGTGALYHDNFASRASLTDLKMTYTETDFDELPFDN
jgi:O-succinylbenzoate synthase